MLTLECGHRFHDTCVLSWFRSNHHSHGHCPLCRHNPTSDASEVDPEEVSSNEMMLGVVTSVARRKLAPPVIKLAYNRLCTVSRKKETARSALRDFERANRALLKERRRMAQKLFKYARAEQDAQRALCAMHPIVPITIHCCEEVD